MTIVSQTDPRASYRARQEACDAAIRRVLDSGHYILGAEVAAFEAEFAAFTATSQGIGVANGTDALVLALEALGVGHGDTVVTVSHTAVATVAAIKIAGALPVLVDVDDRYGMDPAALDAVLGDDPATGRIKAVIPVHLYGQPVDLDAILEIAGRRGVMVVEDASQAHGATWRGRPVGGFGAAAAFSLYPTKNLGALGDGGIVTTDDAELAGRLRALRQYGWGERYVSTVTGRNSRLDELQAAILRVKLAHLAADNQRRQEIAAFYDRELAGLPFDRPCRREGASHVFHQYVIELDRRDAVRERLRALGIATNVHYPVPVHRQPAYRGRVTVGPGGLGRTDRIADRILSLPMYPQLTDDQAGRVVESLKGVLS